jgi:8-oxo-dGTP diphosphatase
MPDLLSQSVPICQTACAFLIHQAKIILVKHRKLQLWLAPGGHSLENEMPHQTAERECFEETGNRVEALSAYPNLKGSVSQYLPLPFAVNLHWINQGNCRQHVAYLYLVRLLDFGISQQRNVSESDALGWFSKNQIDSLDTTGDIKAEIKLAFKLSKIV